MSERLACDITELGTLFLFESLDPEQLTWLCERGHVEVREVGPVFTEGDPATCFFVLLDGEVALSRRVGNDDVEISRTDQRGAYAGATAAYLGDRIPQIYQHSIRALRPSRFYVLAATDFSAFMSTWFPMPVHLLEGLFMGTQKAQDTVARHERLLALGSLSAGLTHELNNPAAAAVRATATLRERVAGMRQKLRKIAGGTWDRAVLESVIGLQEQVVELVAKAPELTPLEASDREDLLVDWFEEHDVPGAYAIAPTFVAAGVDVGWLDKIEALLDDGAEEGALAGAVHWLNYTLETELLMNEITDATTRISTLVDAAKQYSQMDRAPYQVLDIHELLDSTLVMLSRKIPAGVAVVKDYDRTLPQVPVYGAELNQVWTNVIDNALQAMADSGGTLTVSTSAPDPEHLRVEIADTGPGIPDDVVGRIFDPFFTTKPVGQGTGLGLDIAWRIVVNKHGGDLSVTSRPGDTRFRITLPVRPDLDPGQTAS